MTIKVGDKVSLAKYAAKFPLEFDGDRTPTNPCTVQHVECDGCHVSDALGRLWFAFHDEFEPLNRE